MINLRWLVVAFFLSGCTTQHMSADKVFSNAQVQYQLKANKKELTEKRAMEMPSYFLDLEYESFHATLNEMQYHQIDLMLKKILYPDEYKFYISFGVGGSNSQMSNLALVYKRAQDIKHRFGSRIKHIKIAYLKNQKTDTVYLRLLG
jgi:hypothetical protein